MSQLLTAAILAMLMDTACAYDPRAFEGDGILTDRGFWSYRPRYTILLRPSVSLTTVGQRQYKFKGAPDDPLLLTLRIENDNGDGYQRLRGLHTSIETVLVEEDGNKMVCRAEGRLDDWTLMWTSGRGGAYWKRECSSLRLERQRWYRLTVIVTGIDPASPPLVVAPVLSGGGWDSP